MVNLASGLLPGVRGMLSDSSRFVQQRQRQRPTHCVRVRHGMCVSCRCKYGGRPHWGKNYRRTFTHPKCSIPERFGASMDTARRMQAQHDPDRIFEPEMWQSINNPQYALYPRYAPSCTP